MCNALLKEEEKKKVDEEKGRKKCNETTCKACATPDNKNMDYMPVSTYHTISSVESCFRYEKKILFHLTCLPC